MEKLGFLAPRMWGERRLRQLRAHRRVAALPRVIGDLAGSDFLAPTEWGARKWRPRYPAIASGLALLLGIWMSISSVDMVSPRSIETWR
ncbi:hypothetical protein SAMN02927914_05850 [Mesorhizobium qingshengii]|uniref:Uncharacterized protein n=1 Tax=Mesorhizobium qingshengii TaxID=1165689 RepID=A0A1G5ZRV7_9HYPH|nr:hypothetical protein SAMN02927914_05850 [Mesorhizobium qingshengii]